MGLDMYLNKETYIWTDWEIGKRKLHELKMPESYSHIKPERISNITEQVAYWRKANEIHKWFIDHVMGGEYADHTYVKREQIADLVAVCKEVIAKSEFVDGEVCSHEAFKDGKWVKVMVPGKVIKNPEIAASILPTESGFFFGSTEYNEWYIQSLQNTIDQLEPLLSEKDGDLFYRASW